LWGDGTSHTVDGKHVAIKHDLQNLAGSLRFGHKGFCLIVLMTLANANFRFINVEGDFNVVSSDGSVFFTTHLREMLRKRAPLG